MRNLIVAIVLSLFATVGVAQGNGKDVKQAVEKVKKQTGGQVLSTSVKTIGGQRMIRVKVLDKDGVVRYVNVKAKP